MKKQKTDTKVNPEQGKFDSLPYIKRLLNRGFSLKEARDYAADGLLRDANLCRSFRLMANRPQGRAALRECTLVFREYGLEPPFAEIINLKELMQE